MITGILLIGFATFAVVYVAQETDGPWDIFMNIRLMLGIEVEVEDGYVRAVNTPDNFWTDLYSCYWCLSTWVCMLMSLGYILLGYARGEDVLFLWFASLGVAGFVRAVHDNMMSD